MKTFCVLLLWCSVVYSLPTNNIADGKNSVLDSVLGAVKECADGDVSLCLKERALKYAESISPARELSIVDGISLIGNGSPRSARSFEPLSEEPVARENQIESRLLDTAADFLENHVIQLRMPRSTVDEVKRSIEEGRGKKKKLKKLLPILALLKLKIAALIPLFLAIIAFAAVKAVLLGKIALVVSGLLLLKKLLASKHAHHETYEVVAHPHHEEHYSGGGGGAAVHEGHGGGWGRSSVDPQEIAYNAYANIKS